MSSEPIYRAMCPLCHRAIYIQGETCTWGWRSGCCGKPLHLVKIETAPTGIDVRPRVVEPENGGRR